MRSNISLERAVNDLAAQLEEQTCLRSSCQQDWSSFRGRTQAARSSPAQFRGPKTGYFQPDLHPVAPLTKPMAWVPTLLNRG